MAEYVIRAKRIKDILGNSLSEEEQCWDYAQNDSRCLCPSFTDESLAFKFSSITEAKKWYSDAKIYLKDDKHDWSTVAICELTCTVVEKLEI